MDDVLEQPPKLHIVCLRFPAQGHVNPMLKVAISLHHKGFFITFVNTETLHNCLLNSSGPNSMSGLPDFQFETIPDGLLGNQAPGIVPRQGLLHLVRSLNKNSSVPFKNLLKKMNSLESVPNVTCVISDAITSFAVDAARKIGIPCVCLRTTNALSYLVDKYLPLIMEKGLLPLKDASNLADGYLETNIDFIPALKGLRLKDFPSLMSTTDKNDPLFNSTMKETEGSSKASAILFNTFEALETDTLNALSPLCPPIYTIGPIHSLAIQCPKTTQDLIKGNLWKEETECLQWLNLKEDKSLVYVNFGSIAVLTPQELAECAWGLGNSEKDFLWILRSGSVVGDSTSSVSSVLPGEFLEKTKGRGMISGWCPQEVLNHPSIGVFLTHCGWNSMIESLAAGVPMICWPFFGDQHLNCRFACEKWGVGVEIDRNVRRDEVEKIVRETMEGKGGGKLRNRACEWKGKIEAAIDVDGSSVLNIDKLLHDTSQALDS